MKVVGIYAVVPPGAGGGTLGLTGVQVISLGGKHLLTTETSCWSLSSSPPPSLSLFFSFFLQSLVICTRLALNFVAQADLELLINPLVLASQPWDHYVQLFCFVLRQRFAV